MTHELLVATFASADGLLAAARSARVHGLILVDAYSPHPVHGLDEALGLPPSRLPWACFWCGVTGVAFMTWFQLWTSAVDWRLNVGGRPWNSSLSFVCVTFEVMVLLAGLGATVALLLRARLYPGQPARLPAAGVTDDRYALVVGASRPGLTREEVRAILAAAEPLAMVECWRDEVAA